jgi:hypothetical protein
MAETTAPVEQKASRFEQLRHGHHPIQHGRVFTHWDAIKGDLTHPAGKTDSSPGTVVIRRSVQTLGAYISLLFIFVQEFQAREQ